MILQFGQVEIRARAVGDQGLGVVEEEETEIEERGRDGFAIDQKVLFHQVPAARADHQDGRGLAHFVELSLGAGVGDGAAHGIAQVDLSLDDVAPGGRVGIFEIGHEDVGAGIERVDDHLAVDRAGDFDAAVQKVGWDRGHLPVAIPYVRRGRQKLRHGSGVDFLLAFTSVREQLTAARFERARQLGQEAQGFLVEDGFLRFGERGSDLDRLFLCGKHEAGSFCKSC